MRLLTEDEFLRGCQHVKGEGDLDITISVCDLQRGRFKFEPHIGISSAGATGK